MCDWTLMDSTFYQLLWTQAYFVLHSSTLLQVYKTYQPQTLSGPLMKSVKFTVCSFSASVQRELWYKCFGNMPENTSSLNHVLSTFVSGNCMFPAVPMPSVQYATRAGREPQAPPSFPSLAVTPFLFHLHAGRAWEWGYPGVRLCDG